MSAQALKWAVLSVPVVAGIAVALQQTIKSSVILSVASSVIAPPIEDEPINLKPSTNLESQPSPNSRPQVQVSTRKNANQVSQNVDLSTPLFSKLHDYTFKLYTPCSVGTGWILDYLLPRQAKNYPTVWYIATAAHVVKNWHFEKSKNTYKQELPKKCKPKWNIDVYLEVAKRDERLEGKPGARLLKKQKITNPKLFWTALNLFEKDVKKGIGDNNFKDFAVIEVTFDNAKIAREMTRDFADKYTTTSNNHLDIFGEALEPEKTQDDDKSLFYSFGYPLKDTDESFVKNNWSEGKKGDTLSKDPHQKYGIPNNQKVRGFLSAKHFQGSDHEVKWGDKKYTEFGHFYYTNGVKLGAGASGSMVVDANGKVLGVRALERNYSLYTPLRSKAIKKGEIITPEYDLILGAKDQKSSYKDQVERYLLKDGRETLLSSLKKWKPAKQT